MVSIWKRGWPLLIQVLKSKNNADKYFSGICNLPDSIHQKSEKQKWKKIKINRAILTLLACGFFCQEVILSVSSSSPATTKIITRREYFLLWLDCHSWNISAAGNCTETFYSPSSSISLSQYPTNKITEKAVWRSVLLAI